jgi:tRNA pseudouridine38-40 synthase
MTRLRIDLAYDGGDFSGWAKQPSLRTVQGTLENALHKVLRVPDDDADEPLRLTVAGRTDAGVHASHQVAHLDVGDGVLARCVGHMGIDSTQALARRLRAVLPADIVIHGVCVAPAGFDARFSALERTYVYRIADRASEADPRLRGCVLRVDESLDLSLMNRAASMTIGLHDFGSFASPNPGGTTIREVKAAVWQRVPVTYVTSDASYATYATYAAQAAEAAGATEAVNTTDAVGIMGTTDAVDTIGTADATNARNPPEASASPGNPALDKPAMDKPAMDKAARGAFRRVASLESGLVVFTIVADAFARNMVRSLVGSCVKVGSGRKSLDWFAGKMADPVREGSSGPIAPQGLTLEHIAYPADDRLAARAKAIRAVRTL